jgi:DNA-binding NtrC family response regulator
MKDLASGINEADEAAAVLQPASGRRKDLRALLDDYERRLILLALDAAGGHQRRAAASLGLLPSTLSEKMKRLGLRVRRRAWAERDELPDAP